MLSKLRADGSYVYKNKLMKWILTKYNLELEMKLISTFNHENILENIQKILLSKKLEIEKNYIFRSN